MARTTSPNFSDLLVHDVPLIRCLSFCFVLLPIWHAKHSSIGLPKFIPNHVCQPSEQQSSNSSQPSAGRQPTINSTQGHSQSLSAAHMGQQANISSTQRTANQYQRHTRDSSQTSAQHTREYRSIYNSVLKRAKGWQACNRQHPLPSRRIAGAHLGESQ